MRKRTHLVSGMNAILRPRIKPRRVPLLEPCQYRQLSDQSHRSIPLVKVVNGTFYTNYPSSSASSKESPLFPNLSFELPSNSPESPQTQQHWSILSQSSLARTTFLKILGGEFICLPPNARSFPYITTRLNIHPSSAITYIGFDAERTAPGAQTRGAYLSARYEARKEETDFSLLDFLTGNTKLNAQERGNKVDEALLAECIKNLRLGNLLQLPVGNLSNGQTRRARIAKALMTQPQLLLLDGPFMGLDPPSVTLLSDVLKKLAVQCRPRLVLSLRTGDHIPDWTTHLVALEDTSTAITQGTKDAVMSALSATSQSATASDQGRKRFSARELGEPVVEISGAKVRYGNQTIIGGWPGGLHLTLLRGQRLAVIGPNGSGKTTLLSLITSDHPQTYSQPVKLFGRSRLPAPGERGIALFELQLRIGHSSTEVHSFFPKHLSIRRSLESAWADAPLARPELVGDAKQRIDAVLKAFEEEFNVGTRIGGRSAIRSPLEISNSSSNAQLSWADQYTFRDLPFSSQRLLLFLRSLIARQELVILDEAFSGMDKAVRAKAFDFLENGVAGVEGLADNQAMLVVAHEKGDVPGSVREWMCLPEPAGHGIEQAAPRFGELEGPMEEWPEAWEAIWGQRSRE